MSPAPVGTESARIYFTRGTIFIFERKPSETFTLTAWRSSQTKRCQDGADRIGLGWSKKSTSPAVGVHSIKESVVTGPVLTPEEVAYLGGPCVSYPSHCVHHSVAKTYSSWSRLGTGAVDVLGRQLVYLWQPRVSRCYMYLSAGAAGKTIKMQCKSETPTLRPHPSVLLIPDPSCPPQKSNTVSWASPVFECLSQS